MIGFVEMTAHNYKSEGELGGRFLKHLSNIEREGGSIVAITKDESRIKRAYYRTAPAT